MNFIELFPQFKLAKITELGAGTSLSTAQLIEEISVRASQFSDQGLVSGDRVLMPYGNSIAFFRDLLAIWKIGACAIPIDPQTPQFEMSAITRHASVNFLLKSGTDSLLRSGNHQTTSADEAMILYTSGTSGTPKGVVHTHGALRARLTDLAQHISSEEMHRTLCVLPSHFGHGLIGNSLLPLSMGCELFLAPLKKYSLEKIVDEQLISFLSSVPSQWSTLAPECNSHLGSLRRIHCASSPFSEDVLNRIKNFAPQARIFNVYGMTEMASWASGFEIKSAGDFCKVGSGWGTKFKIESPDSHGRGRVLVDAQKMQRTYLAAPELSSEKYPNGWFDTGDMGRIDPNGDLELFGRADDVIDRAGMKIFPSEVENVLLKNSKIQSVCVFAVPHKLFHQIACAAYTLRDEQKMDHSELEDWTRRYLPAYRVPSRWYKLESLPLNSRGKVSKSEVLEICRKLEAEGE